MKEITIKMIKASINFIGMYCFMIAALMFMSLWLDVPGELVLVIIIAAFISWAIIITGIEEEYNHDN